MRHSKRSLEGEILIDHRASPGLTPDQVGPFDVPVVPKGQVYQSAMAACSHCQAMVIFRPNRSRDRGWCAKCDAYLCDDCAAIMQRTLECNSFQRRLDTLYDQMACVGSTGLILTKL